MRLRSSFVAYPLGRGVRRTLAVIPLIAVIAAGTTALEVLAQSPTATLSGTVVDSTGAVVPDVEIEVLGAPTALRRVTTTNDEGIFAVTLLPPGQYLVTARRGGFATAKVRDVTLGIADRRTLLLTLSPGSIDETVTVEATSLVETESGTIGTHVERKLVENLPINGRSFNSLLELAPGVVLSKSRYGDEGQYSVNGQRQNTNTYLIDGVGANVGIAYGAGLGNTTAGTTPGLSVLGSTSNLASLDAIQEVGIKTSTYAPEYGRTPGGQISVVTRSGTSDFHGTLFEYFRHDGLDASTWFANQLGFAKPLLRHNNFGGVVGGPVLGDRTTFFFSYEGLRLRREAILSRVVPSLAARQQAPEGLRSILNAFSVPNRRDYGDGFAEFVGASIVPFSLDATSIRVDHDLNESVRVFGRYNYAPSDVALRGLEGTSLNARSRIQLATETATLGSTQIFGRRISNDLRLNLSWTRTRLESTLDDFGGAVVPSEDELFPSFTDPTNTYRDILVGDTYTFTGRVAAHEQRQLNLVDHLTFLSGAHTLRFGVDYRRIAPKIDFVPYALGTYFFDIPQADGESRITFGSFNTSYGASLTPVFHNLSVYAQDSWRITPRLSLTYGVRWEFNPPPSDDSPEGAVFIAGADDPATMRLAPPGTPRWKTSYQNFAPRVGVAYQVSQASGRETVLRGGWGVFYDLGTSTSVPIEGTTSSTSLDGARYPLDPALIEIAPASPAPPYSGVPAYVPDLQLPRTYQWSLTVEQALGIDNVLSASYVGAAGRKLLWKEILVNPNPTFARVNITSNRASSDYHALQVHFRRRIAHGVAAIASYTYSHAIDLASSDVFGRPGSTAANPSLDRASASFDVRHSLTAAGVVDLPMPWGRPLTKALLGGWGVDSFFRARSAFPVDVLTGRVFAGIFEAGRPDLVPGRALYLDDDSAPGGRRINAAAFDGITPIIQGRQGTLGRNALRGFGATQLDVAVRRTFALSETARLHLRVEAFNVLNHPNFADPESRLSAGPRFGISHSVLGSTFGGLNSAYQVGGPRSIQLAIKLQY
jgi:hypothetical protein